MNITLLGIPRTKKNSQRIVPAGKRFVIIQSKEYLEWEKDCLKQIVGAQKLKINAPINLQVLIYKKDKRRADLNNFLAAVCDVLVKAEVIEDDNDKIVKSHDGSRVMIDPANPRVEITISASSVIAPAGR